MKKIDGEMFANMAKCKAEISIKDGDADLHWEGNDAGRLFVAHVAVKAVANKLGKTFEETLDILRDFNAIYGLEGRT